MGLCWSLSALEGFAGKEDMAQIKMVPFMDKFMHISIPQLGIAQSAAALEYPSLQKIIDK